MIASRTACEYGRDPDADGDGIVTIDGDGAAATEGDGPRPRAGIEPASRGEGTVPVGDLVATGDGVGAPGIVTTLGDCTLDDVGAITTAAAAVDNQTRAWSRNRLSRTMCSYIFLSETGVGFGDTDIFELRT